MSRDPLRNGLSRRKILASGAAVSSSVLLAGCLGDDEDPAVDDDDDAVVDDDDDDTIVDDDDEDIQEIHITQQVEPDHDYDPVVSNDAYSTRILGHIFDGLYEYGPGAGIEPKLAVGEPETPRDDRYVIEIVDDAEFSNGDPLTAEDVLHTFIAPVVEHTDNITSFDMIDVEASTTIDETTVQFDLHEPYGAFATMTVATNIASKDARLEAMDLTEDEWWDRDWAGEEEADEPLLSETSPYNVDNPIGSGPYEYVDHEIGDFTDLQLRDDYWDDDVEPEIDYIRWVATEDDAARTSQILAQDTDMAKGIAPDDYPTVEDDPDISMHTEVGLGYFYLAYNCNDGPTAEPDVRNGIDHAFDMSAFVDQVIGPAGVNLAAPVGQAILEAWDLPVDEYAAMENEYDPERAAQLIEPHIDGTWEPTFIAPPDDIRQELCERVAGRLNELDFDGDTEIDASAQRFDWGPFLDLYSTGDADDYAGYTLGWTGGTDPDAFMWPLIHENSEGVNQGHYYQPGDDFHDKIAQARSSTDFDERRDLYDEVIRQFLEDKVHSPGYVLRNSLAVVPEVEGGEEAIHAQSSIAPRVVSDHHVVRKTQ